MASLDPNNYTTVFADNFSTDTSVDRNLWGAQWGQSGFNFSGGALNLVSTSASGWANAGFMQMSTGTTAGEGYGLYSVTARLDANQGWGACIDLWPADNIWPGAEIDLLETWDTTRQSAFSTLHWKGADGSDQYQSFSWNVDLTKIHTYALDWQADRLSFYVDNQLFWTTTAHVPKDAAHGGINSTFGAQVTGANLRTQPSDSVGLHLYEMSYSTLKPGVTTTTVDPAPAPVNTTIGTGADALVLKLSQDAYQGSAQYTISVDGKQIGGTQTATAWHSTGQDDLLTVKGDFGAGSHVVQVNFLNDAWGGSPSMDRNLYVDGISFNGTAVSGGTASLLSTGSKQFGFTSTSTTTPAPVSSTIGTGADSLVLKISQDAYQGSAQYTISVDGKQIGGTMTASALHSLGQDDTVTVHGDFAAGSHTVKVTFLNDAWGGSASTDRNLYVDGITYDGVTVSGGTASLQSNGGKSFSFTDVGTTTITEHRPHIESVGHGADALILKLSQDAWQGDAQFTVSVDGKQIGGTLSASALHSSTSTHDMLTVLGDFGSGAHTLKVNFLNDAWGGTAGTDRNLYVDSISYKGAIVSGGQALMSTGTASFSFSGGSASTAPDAVVRVNATSAAEDFNFLRGDSHTAITGFQSGSDHLHFQGLTAADVHTAATTEGGVAGLLITYDTAGSSVFLAGVSSLASGDLVFG